MKLAKLEGDYVTAASESLGPQPQRPVSEVVIDLLQSRRTH
jgi:hypothetical protein